MIEPVELDRPRVTADTASRTAPGRSREALVPESVTALPDTMRAAFLPGYGGPETIELRELPRPSPGESELLVRVGASAVTAADTMMRRGTPFYARAIIGLTRPKHPVPGTGFAGTVEALGRGASGFQPGDRVFGETTLDFGANAEWLVVNVDGVVRHMPDALSFAEAAVACDGAVTALHFLDRVGRIAPGERLLVNGAAGAQGCAAVQIAKARGAHVTAVASARNAEFLKGLGADRTIDYASEDFASLGERWDIVYDTVGKRRFGEVRGALADGGRYLSPVLDAGLLLRMLVSSRIGTRRALFSAAGMQPVDELRARLDTICELIASGELTLPVEHRYPLAQIVAAHRHVEGGHKRGNVVVEGGLM